MLTPTINRMQTPQAKRVARNILTLLLGNGFSQFITIIAFLLIARTLGVKEYGRLTAAYALSTQMATILNFGLDTWLLREGALQKENATTAQSNTLALKALLGLLWVPGLVWLANFLEATIYPPDLMWIIAIGAFSQGIGVWAQTVFKSRMQNEITIFIQITGVAIFFGLVLVAVNLAGEVKVFAAGRTGGFIVAAIIGIFLVFRQGRFKPDLFKLPGLARQSLPFMSIDTLAIIYQSIDITIIALFLGAEASGLYAPAITLVAGLLLFPFTIYNVMIPAITKAIKKDAGRTRVIFFYFLALLGLVGFTLTALLFYGAAPIIKLLYGPQYSQSATVLAVACFVLLIKSPSYALAGILVVINQNRDRITAQLLVALFNVAANLLIIKSYGIVGVAVVYIASEGLLLLSYIYLTLRDTQGLTFANSHN